MAVCPSRIKPGECTASSPGDPVESFSSRCIVSTLVGERLIVRLSSGRRLDLTCDHVTLRRLDGTLGEWLADGCTDVALAGKFMRWASDTIASRIVARMRQRSLVPHCAVHGSRIEEFGPQRELRCPDGHLVGVLEIVWYPQGGADGRQM